MPRNDSSSLLIPQRHVLALWPMGVYRMSFPGLQPSLMTLNDRRTWLPPVAIGHGAETIGGQLEMC